MQLPEEDRRKIALYYGLPFGFAGAIAMFAGFGHWVLDRWLGTSPIFTLIGTLVGAVVGFYYLISRALQIQRSGDEDDTKDGSSEPSKKARDGKS